MKQSELKENKKQHVEIDKNLDQFTGHVASKEKIEKAKERISKAPFLLVKPQKK